MSTWQAIKIWYSGLLDTGLVLHLAQALGLLLLGAMLGLATHRIVFALLRRWVRHTASVQDNRALERLRNPVKYLALIFGIGVATSVAGPLLPQGLRNGLGQILSLAWVLPAVWLGARIVFVIEDLLLAKYDMHKADNLRARKLHTQVQVLNRILVVALVILALGGMLMSIDQFRRIGASLLASAGIAGIILGLAAQKAIGNVLAGIQIAFTQPIRLDDVVVVEGEWGRIEEITFTYVVVRIWDKRRLVLPVSFFLDQPFQNWTRVSADVLGTVFIYADWTLPAAEMRQELERLVQGNELWDGKAVGLQVTDASKESVEFRALVSAADSPALWDLRCQVREGLITWLQREHPGCLPRVRAELGKQAT